MRTLLRLGFCLLLLASCADAKKDDTNVPKLKGTGDDIMSSFDTTYVRPPAVAGMFYPESPSELAKMIAEFYSIAPKPQISGRPVAIISPHAGYVYSGAIAAKGYKVLEGESYSTVVVISPSHTAFFAGVSAFNGRAYSTPLGEIPIDMDLTSRIAEHSSLVSFSKSGHQVGSSRSEHALEVQLPFLQLALGEFKLVALIMGDQNYITCESLGQAIAQAIGKRNDVLIVASSDLSHFHDSKAAGKLDSIVTNCVRDFNYKLLYSNLENGKTEACGGGPIITAMVASKALGAAKVEITGYGDSGDITGDKMNVVGYLSAIICKEAGAKEYTLDADENIESVQINENPVSGVNFGLSADDKENLLKMTRESISSYLENRNVEFPIDISESLKQQLGAFVTLTKEGELRGCIGTFWGSEALYKTIAEMARQAAFADPRFAPVNRDELSHIDIEISVLTPMKKIENPESVVVGRDGLYIKKGFSSGVLLPQVAVEYGWSREEFLDHTCIKAGLRAGTWKDARTEIYIFQAEIFGDSRD